MNTGGRIKVLRKHLKLTQDDFAEKLGMNRANVSLLENGKSNLTEANAKLICREFNVDYFWLTEGTGDMFVDTPNAILDLVSKQYNLDELDRIIVEKYIDMKPEQREVFKTYLKNVVEAEKQKKDEP